MFAVEMRNITKKFRGARANDAVGFTVHQGEIHALVGENGAGKSTLMNILYGMHAPDEGEILIRGNIVTIETPAKAISIGIGMVHQHFMLIPPFTVTENIILGQEPVNRLEILDLHRAEEQIAEFSRKYRLELDPRAKIESLSVGLQQRVEILKILYRRAEILIFDEPTPVLTPQEIEEFFNSLRELKSQGKTIILITHKLTEVMAISDRVTVMRRGKVVGELETASTNPGELARLMVGKDIVLGVQKGAASGKTEAALQVENISALNDRNLPALKDVSISICEGEILGVAAVEGNGQAELVQVITGLRAPTSGRIIMSGKLLAQGSNELRPSHIPDDRLKRGLVLDFSVTENLILGRQTEPVFSGIFFLHLKNIDNFADKMIQNFDIRPPDKAVPVRGLSGGNQQKVVIARELSKNARVIIASQPTRGLDIGAIQFVHRSIIEERNQGKAILLVSSDLTELLSLSDRIAVMYEGRIVAILEAQSTSERELGLYMTGSMKKSA